MSRNRQLCVRAVVCTCLVLIGTAAFRGAEGGNNSNAAPCLHRHIEYGFNIINRTNSIVELVELWTYAPVTLTSTQKCLRVEATEPYTLIVDDLGNQILYFRFEHFSPFAVKPVTIHATIALSEQPGMVSDYRAAFINPEAFVESDAPQIKARAQKLQTSVPVETAKNIFQWVADNIRYDGYLKDTRGALYALRERKGDCTEYMALFAALCRANGVPARGLGGYVCTQDGAVSPASYHNWAEFLDAGAWRLSDPQRRVFMKDASRYVTMRIIGNATNNPMGDAHRFRFSGTGCEVTMTLPKGQEG